MSTEWLHDLMPFARVLGLDIVEADPARVVLLGEWRADLCTSQGILHGGALMASVDTAGALCAFLNLPQDASGTTTIESKTNFLGAVRAGAIRVTSTPVHAGSTTVVVQTDVTDDRDKLVSRSIQTQAVLKPR